MHVCTKPDLLNLLILIIVSGFDSGLFILFSVVCLDVRYPVCASPDLTPVFRLRLVFLKLFLRFPVFLKNKAFSTTVTVSAACFQFLLHMRKLAQTQNLLVLSNIKIQLKMVQESHSCIAMFNA